jgi:pyruvate kinase
VRRVSIAARKHTAIVLDLMGPRYRLGSFTGTRLLKRGETVTIGQKADGIDLPIETPGFLAHLQPRERILIDNGLVELRIRERKGARVVARVVTGGTVSSRKGMNLPDSELPFEISAKDHADLRFAVKVGADYLAASYVGLPQDLDELRATLEELGGGEMPIIAKLERARALHHLDAIVAAADGVMVARGDLGVEVPLHKVPVLQKRIIDAARNHGKPVIVATQMLESMVERPRPTRAESTDVANAVLDGADALMLSAETAVGSHPVRTVRTMARIIREAEAYQRASRQPARSLAKLPRSDFPARLQPPEEATASAMSPFEIADTIASAAVLAGRNLRVKHIVAFSQGGYTARVISRYRPSAPIWMLTTDEAVARRVQLVWGVRPLLLEKGVQHHDEVVRLVDCELLQRDLANPGEAIIVLMGDPIRERPLTNLMRIHRIRESSRS